MGSKANHGQLPLIDLGEKCGASSLDKGQAVCSESWGGMMVNSGNSGVVGDNEPLTSFFVLGNTEKE